MEKPSDGEGWSSARLVHFIDQPSSDFGAAERPSEPTVHSDSTAPGTMAGHQKMRGEGLA